MYGNNLGFFFNPTGKPKLRRLNCKLKKISETSKVFNHKWRFELTAEF